MDGFIWFQVISGWFQVVSAGFSWFHVVPRFSKYEAEITQYENLLLLLQKSSATCFKQDLSSFLRQSFMAHRKISQSDSSDHLPSILDMSLSSAFQKCCHKLHWIAHWRRS